MKKKMKTIIKKTGYIALMAVSFLFITSCVGPEGPMGPPGYDGQNGADGIDGINYTGSAIYDVLPIDWTGDINRYTTTLNVPEINEDIYYDGAVLVYELIEIDPISFNMLPYTYVDNNYAAYMDFDVYLGGIDIFVKEIIDGVNTTARPDVTKTFKVVVIQGISLGALKKKVDVSNFNEVNKFISNFQSVK